jgi:hypothetical protein
VSLHLQTGADVAEEERLRHGRAVPAAAEGVRAIDATTARTPRVVGVRGDDDGGGTDEAERRLVLLRMLLVRLFVLLLVLPVAVVAVLLPQLPLRLQVVPLLLRELAGKTSKTLFSTG